MAFMPGALSKNVKHDFLTSGKHGGEIPVAHTEMLHLKPDRIDLQHWQKAKDCTLHIWADQTAGSNCVAWTKWTRSGRTDCSPAQRLYVAVHLL